MGLYQSIEASWTPQGRSLSLISPPFFHPYTTHCPKTERAILSAVDSTSGFPWIVIARKTWMDIANPHSSAFQRMSPSKIPKMRIS